VWCGGRLVMDIRSVNAECEGRVWRTTRLCVSGPASAGGGTCERGSVLQGAAGGFVFDPDPRWPGGGSIRAAAGERARTRRQRFAQTAKRDQRCRHALAGA
jgi:hypothetical protein